MPRRKCDFDDTLSRRIDMIVLLEEAEDHEEWRDHLQRYRHWLEESIPSDR